VEKEGGNSVISDWIHFTFRVLGVQAQRLRNGKKGSKEGGGEG